MKVGMLWFDDKIQKDLTGAIKRAITSYSEKYGQPTMCCAHPTTLGDDFPDEVEGVSVLQDRSVLPDHLWIGSE